MGTKNPVAEVEKRVHGVRFLVASSSRSQKIGLIALRCEVNDAALFDRAVQHFNGFKLFSGALLDEVLEAFKHEVEEQQAVVESKEEQITRLKKELRKEQKETERLRRQLAVLGRDLGIEED